VTTESARADQAGLRQCWYHEGWYSSATCIDWFERAATNSPQTPVAFATEAAETTATVGEINNAAKGFAAGLQRSGVVPGDAVAVQLTNRPECAIASGYVIRSMRRV
jgi:acyl-CoA synthetase (AMP-forming)/AMP-acid ligase II